MHDTSTYGIEADGPMTFPEDALTFGHGDAAECHAEPPTCGCPEAVAAAALAATPTRDLMRAAYALTHRIHECKGNTRAGQCDGPCTDLRVQRDLIDAEVLRRTGDAR